jgi:hypothetical protein
LPLVRSVAFPLLSQVDAACGNALAAGAAAYNGALDVDNSNQQQEMTTARASGC